MAANNPRARQAHSPRPNRPPAARCARPSTEAPVVAARGVTCARTPHAQRRCPPAAASVTSALRSLFEVTFRSKQISATVRTGGRAASTAWGVPGVLGAPSVCSVRPRPLCATTSAPRAGACHGALRGVGPSRTSAKLFNQRNGRSSTKPRAHASLPAPRVSQSWAAALLGGCLGRGGVRGAAGRRRRRRCGRQVHAQPQDQSTLRTACQTQTSAVVVWGQVDGGGRGIEL